MPPAHHVMCESRRRNEGRCAKPKPRRTNCRFIAFSPGETIARRARLDIPCRAPTNRSRTSRSILSNDKLASTIDDAFEARDKIGLKTKGAVRKAVERRARAARLRQGAGGRAKGRRPVAGQPVG